jgi:glycosyltransferase involved in cell wall biosynthesis
MAREMGPGGTERQLVELAKSLNRDRFEPHVAYFLEGVRSAELESAGVRCNRIAVRSFIRPHVIPAAARFARYVRRHKIQIAHAYDFPLIAFGVPVARAAGVPVVLSSQRGSRTLIPNSYRRIVRWTDRLVDGIVVNCEAMRNHLVTDERVSRNKIRLCYNGVDLDHFSPKPGPPPGADPSKPVTVGTVSVQRPEKNIAILLHAFSMLSESRPNMKLLLVGNGSETPVLKVLAQEIGIGEKCEFLPSQADVAPALHEMDIFVLPSRTEALSNSLMEAMACGCAVIASRVGGNPELVEHKSTGLLFESDDIHGLATCLEALVDHPDGRNRLALAASARMRSFFSLPASAQQMESIYNEFIARKVNAERYR